MNVNDEIGRTQKTDPDFDPKGALRQIAHHRTFMGTTSATAAQCRVTTCRHGLPDHPHVGGPQMRVRRRCV